MLWEDIATICNSRLKGNSANYITNLKTAEIIASEQAFLIKDTNIIDLITGQNEYSLPSTFVKEIIIYIDGTPIRVINNDGMIFNVSGASYTGFPYKYLIKNDTTLVLDVYPSTGSAKYTIASITDGTGKIIVTTDNDHGYSTGDSITLEDTGGFDGTYTITVTGTKTFTCPTAWVAGTYTAGTANTENNRIRIEYFRRPTTAEQAGTSPTVPTKYHMQLINYALMIEYSDDPSGKELYYKNLWDQFIDSEGFKNKPRPARNRVPIAHYVDEQVVISE